MASSIEARPYRGQAPLEPGTTAVNHHWGPASQWLGTTAAKHHSGHAPQRPSTTAAKHHSGEAVEWPGRMLGKPAGKKMERLQNHQRPERNLTYIKIHPPSSRL